MTNKTTKIQSLFKQRSFLWWRQIVPTKAFKIKVKPKIMVLYLWFGHQMLRPPNNILGLKTKKI
jgi:hypothetical protein